jgi:hypothetical protein
MNRAPRAAPGTIVTGLFKDRASAERAWRSALELGYRSGDVSLMLAEETRAQMFGERAAAGLGARAAEAAEDPAKGAEQIGGPTGGAIGTIAPVLAAVGTLLLIPGGIVAAGPVAIALTAAGAVGVAGGVIAALTDWGIPKSRLELYEAGIRDGGVLMGVKPRTQEHAQQLATRWRESGGEAVHT